MNDTAVRFSDLDVYYLANTFPMWQLRQEKHQAEINSIVAEAYTGTEYQTKKDLFPWRDYATCCQRAIDCQRDKAKTQPSPFRGKIDIEAIKAKNDIVAIIEGYTKLRKSGRNYTGRCPLHQDHSPSLTVYPDSQTWHCFGACNNGGDVISFIMAAENTDFRGAVAILGGT